MRTVLLTLAGVAAAAPLVAQANPFRSAGANKPALVEYALGGDQSGTEELALAPDRRATRTNGTTRVFGKDVKQNRLEIDTPDSSYRIDFDKKEGYRVPSYSKVMADEYDQLSAADKQRFQANTQALAGVFMQLFGAGGVAQAAQSQGRQTIAGQACDVHKLATFTICDLVGAPSIPLSVEGEFLCLRMNKVATAVTLNSAPPADRFAVPAGIDWKSPGGNAMTEEQARAFVHHMASPQLTDSLAHAAQELQAARDSLRAHQVSAGGAPPGDSLTAAQREQMCRTMREGIQLHLKLQPPNPAEAAQQAVTALVASADSLAHAAVQHAADTAVSKAKSGLFGKIKKPKIP
jgi:hypothetical protein